MNDKLQDKEEITDKDKVVKLFIELGIEYKFVIGDKVNEIVLEEGNQKVKGYIGFFAIFCFDDNDKFLHIDIGE